ncbi:hypothetical protein CLF_102919 [Clonorchis sinensis]|uniref:Uncharacterized protein n=1 Tax=Clonorchis sinensis TaxID=79923 RepID=G7Y8S2_CLOSI|nr:hypothetical protein CLF_102919 [Clonorchis sinensis]
MLDALIVAGWILSGCSLLCFDKKLTWNPVNLSFLRCSSQILYQVKHEVVFVKYIQLEHTVNKGFSWVPETLRPEIELRQSAFKKTPPTVCVSIGELIAISQEMFLDKSRHRRRRSRVTDTSRRWSMRGGFCESTKPTKQNDHTADDETQVDRTRGDRTSERKFSDTWKLGTKTLDLKSFAYESTNRNELSGKYVKNTPLEKRCFFQKTEDLNDKWLEGECVIIIGKKSQIFLDSNSNPPLKWDELSPDFNKQDRSRRHLAVHDDDSRFQTKVYTVDRNLRFKGWFEGYGSPDMVGDLSGWNLSVAVELSLIQGIGRPNNPSSVFDGKCWTPAEICVMFYQETQSNNALHKFALIFNRFVFCACCFSWVSVDLEKLFSKLVEEYDERRLLVEENTKYLNYVQYKRCRCNYRKTLALELGTDDKRQNRHFTTFKNVIFKVFVTIVAYMDICWM